MTTRVTIEAQCAEDTEVNVHVHTPGETATSITTLQDGDEFSVYVYDGRKVSVKEVKKQ